MRVQLHERRATGGTGPRDITALVQASCPLDIGDPTDAAFARYLALEALAQSLNVQVPLLRQCTERVLEALIDKTWDDGVRAPYDASYLQRLIDLTARAQQLGFTAAQTLGRTRTEDLLRRTILFEGASVDGTLAAEIQSALAACVGGQSSLSVTGLKGSIHSWTLDRANGEGQDEFVDLTFAAAAPPFTMTATSSGANGTFIVDQPAGRTVALNLDVTVKRRVHNHEENTWVTGSLVRGDFQFVITTPAAGTVRVEYNRGWTDLSGGLWQAYAVGSDFPNVGNNYAENVATFAVGANQSIGVSGRFDVRNIGSFDVMESHGRFVTITFTPTP